MQDTLKINTNQIQHIRYDWTHPTQLEITAQTTESCSTYISSSLMTKEMRVRKYIKGTEKSEDMITIIYLNKDFPTKMELFLLLSVSVLGCNPSSPSSPAPPVLSPCPPPWWSILLIHVALVCIDLRSNIYFDGSFLHAWIYWNLQEAYDPVVSARRWSMHLWFLLGRLGE